VVLAEVRLDVVRGVEAREVDPGLVACARVVAGTFDEDAHLGEREEIAAGQDIGSEDGEAERSERRDDDVLFRSGGKVHDEGVGFGSEFDLEVCWGRGGGLGRCLDFRFRDLRIDDRRCVEGINRRHRARKWYADNHDVHHEECPDQAAAVLH